MAIRFVRYALLAVLTALGATCTACVDRLPDQDLRIVEATPVARVSADILWQEYLSDPEEADRSYWGKAVVVTGTVTEVGTDTPNNRFVLFGQSETGGVRATLLDEGAAPALSSAAEDDRLTLKCFCEGLGGRDVVLKSCVQP